MGGISGRTFEFSECKNTTQRFVKIIYVGKKQRERIFYYSAAPEISPRSRLPAIIIDIPFRIRFPEGGLWRVICCPF